MSMHVRSCARFSRDEIERIIAARVRADGP